MNELANTAHAQRIENHQHVEATDHNNGERRHLHQRRHIQASMR
ncbi:Uncharacterised protein [Shigella flexneri]|nr:Uncharacterised protein [Shigella flexneri]